MLTLVLLVEIGFLATQQKDPAGAIVRACARQQYKPGCYDREIPKLMKRMSMEEVFGVTKTIQSQDSSYAYCHVLGHALSSAETKKDPAKWKDVVARCPSGVCSNGCVHGAFQERFRTDVLSDDAIEQIKPDLATACEPRDNWNPTGMEQATCYHALGHLLMYITGADVRRSTNLCDAFTSRFRQVCYDGAFMQIFQPLEPEDIALVKGKQPTRQTVNQFCAQYSGERKASCVGESWPLFFQELTQNPQFVETFCSNLEGDLAKRCYNGIFYILVVQFRFDLNTMRSYCEKLSNELSSRCFANTASRLIETDWGNIATAVDWCAEKKVCLDELVSYASYNFHTGSDEFFALCKLLPNPWRETCLQN